MQDIENLKREFQLKSLVQYLQSASHQYRMTVNGVRGRLNDRLNKKEYHDEEEKKKIEKYLNVLSHQKFDIWENTKIDNSTFRDMIQNGNIQIQQIKEYLQLFNQALDVDDRHVEFLRGLHIYDMGLYIWDLRGQLDWIQKELNNIDNLTELPKSC